MREVLRYGWEDESGAATGSGWPGDARREKGEERGLGSRTVTRVVLAAKGGIHGPQRERRARAGPALHRPPLITFFRATARRHRQYWESL